jgi:Putative restriction endonuclease
VTHKPDDPWPPDDTEESVCGYILHGTTITNLCIGIAGAARLARVPAGPEPWRVLSHTALSGFLRPDGSPFLARPDLYVLTHDFDHNREPLSIHNDGLPVLIIEVVTKETFERDLDVLRGKGWIYAHAGVLEYLVLDPMVRLIPGGARGWRLTSRGYDEHWLPEAHGRWHSRSIGVSIGFHEGMATVYTNEGRRMLRDGEYGALMARQRTVQTAGRA